MELLKTISAPNTLQAHGLNHIAIYADPTVSLYRKNPATNELLLQKTWTLAGVKRLALSDNGKILTAQTSTQTHRLSTVGQSPFDVVGVIASADADYSVVLTPTAVQVIRDTVVNMTATLNNTHKVVCGPTTFVVYNTAQYILGSYAAGLQAPVAQAKALLHVTHVAKDNFAFFYNDGTVTYRGRTRTLPVMNSFRRQGQHVVGADASYEWAYQTAHPLTYPERIRPYVPPPPPDIFVFDAHGGTNVSWTMAKTSGVTVEENPSIGDVTYVIPNGTKEDYIEITLAQAINLATQDWTLEWSSYNDLNDGSTYYAEILMASANSEYGVCARYGDSGFGNRMQFGGLISTLQQIYNASATKTSNLNVLRRYALVKQGSTITVYIDDTMQKLAVGTGTTYDQNGFPVDADLTAIKRIRLGRSSAGGYALPAKRGKVTLSMYAKRIPTPQPFSLFNADGTLNSTVTNSGATVAPNLVTFSGSQYLTVPGSGAFVPRTDDFEVEYEILFTAMPAAVSGTSIQPVLYWGNWALAGQPVNFDFYYINTSPARHGMVVSHDSPPNQYMTYNTQAVVGQWYSVKWARKSGVLKLYINGVEVASQDFAYDITYDSTQPMVFGRRRGGSAGTVYWYAQMQLRKFTIKIG